MARTPTCPPTRPRSCEVGGAVLANGRDPYFPAWPDVVQLNAFAEELRGAATDVLTGIAEQCDGVRCDMAMLMMNDVFARTWGGRVGPAPQTDYWPEVIGRVRESHPGFLFLAEAYWDLEWDLQQQGFDYCYDKRLYDRLLQRARPSRCTTTCWPISGIRIGCCGSWRTTTSRGRRRRSGPSRVVPPRSRR